MRTSVGYKRGFRAAIDAVLNKLQTIYDEYYEDSKKLQHQIFKEVSLIKPPDKEGEINGKV